MSSWSGGARAAALGSALALVVAAGARECAAKVIRVPQEKKSITLAVKAAADGDTVAVSPGVYSRAESDEALPIYVERKAIVITGVGDPAKVILVPDGTKRGIRQEGEVGSLIVRDILIGQQVVIRGLTIRAQPGVRGVGVEVYRGKAHIEDCRFLGLEAALRVSGQGVARAVRNQATDCAMGLSVLQGEAIFEDNEVTGSKKGISVEYASAATIRRNRCLKPTADGISVFRGERVVVEDNYVEGAPQCGISVRASSPDVRGNEIVGCKYGIWLTERSAPHITRNTVRGSVGYDLGCENDAEPVVGGNLEDANSFLSDGVFAFNNLTAFPVDCRFNFWGADCVSDAMADNIFHGPLKYKPWVPKDRSRPLDRCP